jgi:hypothetical protein
VNNLIAVYPGDANYLPAYAPIFALTVADNDFTIAATTQNIDLRSVSGLVDLSCKVTGGPARNTVLPRCIVPSKALVPSSKPSNTIVRVDASLVLSGGRINKYVPVPSGTYTAVITGQTAGTMHNVAVTINVKQDHQPAPQGRTQ